MIRVPQGFGARAASGSALALLLMLSAQPGIAQTQTEKEIKRVQDAQAQSESNRAAASAAARRGELRGSNVTFEQVLADPDNIDLNYQFAAAEAERGNLRSAAGTLERILILDPNRVDVRLSYAIVLYRLESFERAKQEFTTVSRADLPPSLRLKVDSYVREITLRQRKTRYFVQGAFGIGYDTNRNSGPDGNTILVAGVPRNIGNTRAASEQDSHATVTAIFGVNHDLDTAYRTDLYGSAGFYQAEQTELSTFDTTALFAEGGTKTEFPLGVFTTKIYGSLLGLSHENYLNLFGGEIRFDHKVDDKVSLYESVRFEKQNYQPIGENQVADNDDGVLSRITAGMRAKIRRDILFDGYLSVHVKNANRAFESYEGPAAGGTFTFLLPQGMFAQLRGSITIEDYQAINAFIAPVLRSDKITRLGGTLGMPLTNLLGNHYTPNWLGGSVVTLGIDFVNSNSSIQNFDYRDVRFAAVLNKRWDF